MKTSGWVASGIGAVVLVGGGIWAATTLPSDDETAYTGSYEPAITETPEPAETATVEPDESAEPAPEETVEPEYTEAEADFLPWARGYYEAYRADAPRLPEMSDQDMLDALHKACEINGDRSAELVVIPGFESIDDLNPDNAEDDANLLFIDAARTGNGAGLSYCD